MENNNEIKLFNYLDEIKDYWCNEPDLTTPETIEGMVKDIMDLFDGSNSINGYYPYIITDEETDEEYTDISLHDAFCDEDVENDFAKAVRDAMEVYLNLSKDSGKETNNPFSDDYSPTIPKEVVASSVIRSILDILDGNSEWLDYHEIEIIETETDKCFVSYDLRELYCKMHGEADDYDFDLD